MFFVICCFQRINHFWFFFFAKTSVFYTYVQSCKVSHLKSCFGLSHNFWNMPFSTWIYLFLMLNSKIFTFVRNNLYENFRKKFTLRGHVSIFLKVILQSSLYFNGYLQLGKLIFYYFICFRYLECCLIFKFGFLCGTQQ